MSSKIGLLAATLFSLGLLVGCKEPTPSQEEAVFKGECLLAKSKLGTTTVNGVMKYTCTNEKGEVNVQK